MHTRIATRIRANANAIHRREITWEEFSRRNSALWREAEALGIADAVHAALREMPYDC